jgi:hypothetical protein
VIDAYVPGNVRLPFIVEKIGAAAMGLIAGLISAGIVAVAADALPFGPSIGMYARFGTVDQKDPQFSGANGQMQDTENHDVFSGDQVSADDPTKSGVWFRQDDLVVDLAKKISAEDGSLANDHPFASVHPDLLDELYAQRMGIQTGARHTAVNTDQVQVVTVKGVYTPPVPIPQVDGEPPLMRISGSTPPPATVTADGDHIVLVVRMSFSGKDLADDADGLLRFSAGSIRLVAGQPGGGAEFKNYYPVATLDARGTAVACHPDDFLLADMSGARTIDVVFVADRDHVMTDPTKPPPFQLPPDTFVEFKRYGSCDISGQTVEFGPPPNSDKTPVIRKPSVEAVLTKTEGLWTGANSQTSAGDNGSSAEAGGDHSPGGSGLSFIDITASNKLAAPINCGTGDTTGPVQLPNGVTGELDHRQWTQLTVSADTPMEQLGQPQSDDVQELAVDPNTDLVQVQYSAPVSGSSSQMWEWGNRVADFALADATGHTYPCVGVWATAQRGTIHYFVVNYKNFDDQHRLQAVSAKKGRPVNVWLAFQVPSGTPIAEIRFGKITAMDNLNFKAP